MFQVQAALVVFSHVYKLLRPKTDFENAYGLLLLIHCSRKQRSGRKSTRCEWVKGALLLSTNYYIWENHLTKSPLRILWDIFSASSPSVHVPWRVKPSPIFLLNSRKHAILQRKARNCILQISPARTMELDSLSNNYLFPRYIQSAIYLYRLASKIQNKEIFSMWEELSCHRYTWYNIWTRKVKWEAVVHNVFRYTVVVKRQRFIKKAQIRQTKKTVWKLFTNQIC